MLPILISSGVLILLVALLRTVLRGRVRACTLYALWLICALRLLLPFSFGETRISLENALPPAAAQASVLPAETLDAEIAAVPIRQESILEQQTVPAGSDEPLPPPVHRTETVRRPVSLRSVLRILRWAGTAAVLLVFCISDSRFFARLRRGSREDTAEGVPVRRSPGLSVPCLYGRTIWVPDNLSGKDLRFAVVHEQAHLRHADPVWTVLRIVLLAFWWFDPLIWLAAFVSKRDAELAADESAVAVLGEDARLPYARTLLALGERLAAPRNLFIAAYPMVGRSGLFIRIRQLTKKQRRSAVALTLAVLVMLTAAACAFTGGTGASVPEPGTLSAPSEGDYPDLLAFVQTKLNTGDVNRTTNVRLACEACAEVILQPGGEFSFNGTLGPRTEERGYKDAKIYLSNEIIDGIGGGICQLSSTIYMAVMRADLEVIERWSHRYAVSWCPDGEDAAVSYGSRDFRFINNTEHPIRLTASLDGEEVSVSICGTRTQDKTVTIETETLGPDEPYEKVTVTDPALAPGSSRKGNQSGRSGRRTVTYRVVTVDGVTTRKLENYSIYEKLDVVDYIGPEVVRVSQHDADPLSLFPVLGDSSWKAFAAAYPDEARAFDRFGTDGPFPETVFGDPVPAMDTQAGILLAEVSGDGWDGVLAIVRDPSKVSLAVSETLGQTGQRISALCEAQGALLGVNASAYSDEDGRANGGSPLGYVVSDGVKLGEPEGWQIVGFDKDDRLLIGRYDALDRPLRDAVEFKPALLLNGEIVVSENDGWGINPRTAIGQTSDGSVLLLVVNGRSERSLGCRNYDCALLLSRYGAVNACALDNGSSSVMYYNGRVVTRPSCMNKTEGRQLPDAWVVVP